MTVVGKPVPHALCLRPLPDNDAILSYTLGCKYDRFCVSAALVDSATEAASGVTFEVIGDGKSLWRSRPLFEPRDVARCYVSVFTVDVLELVVHVTGDSTGCDAAWLEPRLSGKGAAVLQPGLLLAAEAPMYNGTPVTSLYSASVPMGTLVTTDLFGGEGRAVKTGAKTAASVRMRFLDEETGVCSEADVPFEQVLRVRRRRVAA